jgi:CDP-diacylglycerol---glycerol-3-phosphate 3-phosphatidyltransferase
MANLTQMRRDIGYRIANPMVRILARSSLKPDTLTLLGLAVNLGAAYTIARDYLVLGGVLVLVSGIFDLLDGALARFAKRATKFGAILDSTVDRVSEAAVLFGLIVWYVSKGAEIEILLVFAVLIGSFLVSYVRARGEGLGLQCQVGLFTRAERVIVLAVGLLLSGVDVVIPPVTIALWILLVFVYVTVAQRLFYLRKQANSGGG